MEHFRSVNIFSYFSYKRVFSRSKRSARMHVRACVHKSAFTRFETFDFLTKPKFLVSQQDAGEASSFKQSI